jgi:hypothetical protein
MPESDPSRQCPLLPRRRSESRSVSAAALPRATGSASVTVTVTVYIGAAGGCGRDAVRASGSKFLGPAAQTSLPVRLNWKIIMKAAAGRAARPASKRGRHPAAAAAAAATVTVRSESESQAAERAKGGPRRRPGPAAAPDGGPTNLKPEPGRRSRSHGPPGPPGPPSEFSLQVQLPVGVPELQV